MSQSLRRRHGVATVAGPGPPAGSMPSARPRRCGALRVPLNSSAQLQSAASRHRSGTATTEQLAARRRQQGRF